LLSPEQPSFGLTLHETKLFYANDADVCILVSPATNLKEAFMTPMTFVKPLGTVAAIALIGLAG
jgi:hypothetical protein